MNEFDPLTSDEQVLRRILNRFDYYDPITGTVSRVAFSPTKKDINGISIFRSLFTTPGEVIAAGNNPAGYVAAELNVTDIVQLGLSLDPDPQDDQPSGHTLIPDITPEKKKANKRYIKEMELKLSQLAAKAILNPPSN